MKIINRRVAISTVLATILTSSVYGVGFSEDWTSLVEVSANSMAIADLNGDTHNDIFIVGKDSSNNKIAKVYLNDGSGAFTEKTQTNSITGVFIGSVAIDDLNNDGHNDILITGQDGSSNRISKIYINDGTGDFTEDGNSLTGVYSSSVAIDDLNGDGHNDILITGQDGSNNRISKIYLNDGSGNFNVDGNSLIGSYRGSVAIADLDGDSDNDLLITGIMNGVYSSKIYLNDGSGNFTEEVQSPILTGVRYSSVAIADLDGDSDNDILLTGDDSSHNDITKIYLNDGSGSFSEDTSNSLTGVDVSSIAIDDLDNDGDNDILMTGISGSTKTSKIYLNDGSGSFSENGYSLTRVYRSSVAIADLNGDGDSDVVILGKDTSFSPTSKIYFADLTPPIFSKAVGKDNEVTLVFSEDLDTNSIPATSSFIINGSTSGTMSVSSVAIIGRKVKLTLTSSLKESETISVTYIGGSNKIQNQVSNVALDLTNENVTNNTVEIRFFEEDTINSLTGVKNSSITMADLDGDTDNDILITGYDSSNSRITKIYLNDGTGVFSEDASNTLAGVQNSSIAIADLNGDTHNDILITGSSDSGNISKIYLNDGSGNFTEDVSNSLDGVTYSSVAIDDLNNDGYNDILISGLVGPQITKIYLNDGSGSFTEDVSNTLTAVFFSSVAIKDLDGDSDNDILITGADSSFNATAKIYLNNGSGSFTEDVSNTLTGVTYSSVAIADLDGDSDSDILITGNSNSGKISKIYLNDGSGAFSEDTSNSLTGVYKASVAIADLDGDSYNDILISGVSNSGQITKIYLNDGAGTFNDELHTDSLKTLAYGSLAIADLDGDSYNDILLTGQDNSNGNKISSIYLSKRASVDLSSVVIANKWNMIAVSDKKKVTASNMTGATIWTFNNTSNAWENPTTLTAGKGYIVYTASTTGYDSISAIGSLSTITDDYTTIKAISNNSWTLVGISKSTSGISWSDIYNSTNTLKASCNYVQIFHFDSTNDTWNTTSNIPYLSSVWAKQYCSSN